MSDTTTLYKLIVLYMLNRVDFPLTTSQISDFILEREYTNYFNLQNVLAESVTAGLIRVENTHNRTLYHLTEEGFETIQYFQSQISPGIQEDIDNFFKQKEYDLKNETSIKADYYRNDLHEYSVHLQVLEKKHPLIDLTVTVPSESVAESIANNWLQKNQQIYALIMEHLL